MTAGAEGMEGLIHGKMSLLKLEAVAVLVLVLLAACGDEDAGPSRAGVQDPERTEQSDLPEPPAPEPDPTSTPMTVPVPSGSPRPPAGEPVPTSSPVKEPVPSASPTPSPSPAVVADRQASDSPEEALAEDRQLVRVRRGDLVTSIFVNGSIAFPNTGTVVFEAQGALGSLAVEEGRTVTMGQPLAHMDRATVTALEEALAQTWFDASTAREALADALAPSGPLETARAEARVADAVEALLTTEEHLLSLLRPTGREMATAESARADAILKIDGLRDEIASLVGGPDEKELEHLRVHTRSDQVLLENALRGESLAEEEWDTRLGRASGEVEAAAQEYRAFFLEWLGVEPQHVDAGLPPDALLKQWGADLDSLYGSVRGDLRQMPSLPANDPGTAWNEQTVWAYTHLAPFEVRVSCGGSGSGIDFFCLTEEMNRAWNGLFALRAELHSLETKAAVALATAHNAVDEARDDVASNTEHLEDLMAPADPLLIRSKERELALAETALAETEAFLAVLRERLELGLALDLPVAAPGTGEGIDTAMLDDVSESLRRDLLNARRDIEDALLDLRVAEESLDALNEPSDPVLVALREAQLATAELEVEEASHRLEGVTLTSPITGIVTGIAVRAGEYVERGALAMTVVDPTVVEVRGAVDETGVLHVQVGAPAKVLLRALPGRSLSGAVSYVSPTANKQEGDVTFDVRIRLEAPKVTGLRSGLTAVAELVLRSEADVLLIPLQALRGEPGLPAVLAWEDGVITEKHITTGSDDGSSVVVESGLSEGDVIIMEGGVEARESWSGENRN